MQTLRNRKSRLEWAFFSTGLHFVLLLAFLAIILGLIFFQSYLRQLSYKRINGRVIKSIAEPCEDGMATPTIRFSYTINRRKYTSGKYRDDFGKFCVSHKEVAEVLSKYPVGLEVEAWYDPDNPSRAVISRSLGMLHYGVLLIFGMFSLILGIAWWFKQIEKDKSEGSTEKKD